MLSISKLDSLGAVAVKPVEFHIKAQIPFVDLAVPIWYKLNEYKVENENNYIPKHENRLFRLRTGAEDELTQIDSNMIRPTKDTANKNPAMSAQSKKVTMEKSTKSLSASTGSKPETQIIDLVPSKQLSEPVDYSPMHIFVFISFKY